MARMNWSKARAQNVMARRGVESARGDMPFGLPKPRGPFRRPPSKAEISTQTAGLVEKYRGEVTSLPTIVDLKCPCGHQGKARVPQGGRQHRFRCRQCGSSQSWPPCAGSGEATGGDAS
jgi:hypothetical protein